MSTRCVGSTPSLAVKDLATILRRTCSITIWAICTSSVPRRKSSAHGGRLGDAAPDRGRARGATREADEALAAEMLADRKEIAEHVMPLDLGRNAVGRVAIDRNGSGHREEAVERY